MLNKEMTKKEVAMLIATKAHSSQSYDIYPYTYHLKATARIAESLGYDESIIVACILHDVIEDTDVSYNDIKTALGEEIAEIVYCVTDELGRNRKERKDKTYPKIRSNWKAIAVKLCDRIANMEHSQKYTPKMFSMYKNETPKFLVAIASTHPELEKAFDYINNL